MTSVNLPLPDPSTISSNASLASRSRLLTPPSIDTTSSRIDQAAHVTTSAEVLATLNVPGNWSGKGQHVALERNEAIPLEQGTFLGRGAFADVHEVICKGIKLARKQIYCNRRMKIEDVKRELDILRKLSHKHVVVLLGSYTQGKVLGLLLHPVAVCDLGMFLDELDEEQRRDCTEAEVGEGLSKLLDRLGLLVTTHAARERLDKAYGCLANAVQYLHENSVRHKDLKPRNILLDRNNGLYVTDFGLSRDITDASSSVTDGIERGTYNYCAPEVAQYRPRGRAADIFTLGCVFLEINTVCRGLSLIDFYESRGEGGDHSFQNSPKQLKDWMLKLRQSKNHVNNLHSGIFDIVDIIEKMVSHIPADRPIITSVCSSLYLLDEPSYFGDCCGRSRYQKLVDVNDQLERDLIEMKNHMEHIKALHQLEKYQASIDFELLSQKVQETERMNDEITATHRSEKAKITSQHEDALKAFELQIEYTRERERFTTIYETKLRETYHRHMIELAETSAKRDTSRELKHLKDLETLTLVSISLKRGESSEYVPYI